MPDVGLSVGRRRPVIKRVDIIPVLFFHAFFKNLVFIPKFQDILFPVYKIQVCRNFLIHCTPPS